MTRDGNPRSRGAVAEARAVEESPLASFSFLDLHDPVEPDDLAEPDGLVEPHGLVDPHDVLEPFCDDDWETLDAWRTEVAASGERHVFAELQATLDAAEGAQYSANRIAAAQFDAIRRAFALAAAHPELYVQPEVVEPRRVRELAARAVAAELSMRLQLPAATVRNRAYEATVLHERLPQMATRFRDGLASYADVKVALEAVAGLEPDATTADGTGLTAQQLAANAEARTRVARLDEELAELAGTVTTVRFRQRARVLRAKIEPPDDVTRRHARALADRRMVVEHAADGMSWVQLFVTSVDAAKIRARLDATAIEVSGHPNEQRSIDQLRADLATDWLTGAGTPTAVRTEIIVTVPMLTLTGRPGGGQGSGHGAGVRVGAGADSPAPTIGVVDAEPAELDGVGPIDPATARELFADAPSFLRLAVDPVTSAPLRLDRTRYRVTKAQRRWLALKYGRCTRPGCNRLATAADIDHLVDWAHGGGTDLENLAPTCRPDHCLKHQARFIVSRSRDGSIAWRSPVGFIAETRPKHAPPKPAAAVPRAYAEHAPF